MNVFYFTLIGSLLTGLFFNALLPWWSIALVAGLAAATLGRNQGSAFLGGFCGAGLSWVLAALVIHVKNGGLLTERMTRLILEPLTGSTESWQWIPLLVLISGLVGGMASLTGFALRTALGFRSN
jgi:hypothetical protein